MSWISALIVDDEAHARRRLRRMLQAIPAVGVVDEAADGKEALEKFATCKPQAVFLDVLMPEYDGIEVARELSSAAIIYVSAHERYAVNAFDVDAVDYLLKPVRKDRLERAVGRLLEPSRTTTATRALGDVRPFVARTGGSTYLLDPTKITRFRAHAKYTVVFMEGREYMLERSLNHIENELERATDDAFVRVHRGELVRLDAVTALHQGVHGLEVELADGQRARVSRRRLAQLRRRLGLSSNA